MSSGYVSDLLQPSALQNTPFIVLVSVGEAAAGQVMTLASAAIKQAQVAFAACVTAQPVMLPDLVSRIRSLLLSSARLTEGELLRPTDDIGPGTAQTSPDKVWRWDLTTDAVPVGTGPGGWCLAPSAGQMCCAPTEIAGCLLHSASYAACTCSYCVHMTSKSSTAILQARKQCICQESLHAAFCNVQQLARCSICTSCTCSDMSAFYQLHSSRFQYMRDMGRCYAPRCNLYKDSKCVVMCVCFLLSGVQAQQLCRAVSEAACSLLAASWRSGDQAGVKAAFLPLSDIEGFSALASTANERQVAPSCFLWQL